MLEHLNDAYISFQQSIIDAEVMLRKNKERFKSGLLAQADEFRKHVGNLISDFMQQGPFKSHFTSDDALAIVAQFK